MTKNIRQCDTKECSHCTDGDICDLKEIETDNNGNCMEIDLNGN